VIKLLTLWATWRLLRAIGAIVVVAALGLLLLGGANHTTSHSESVIGQLQRAGSPLEHELQHTLQKALRP
jgi:hypothetical protein